MRYATAGAFRAALEQRLVTLARQTNVPLVRLRKLVVFDRLLARLMLVAPGRWVLKGAVALNFRIGTRFRTTRDMDLGRQDDEEAATADFIAAQAVDIGDYFTFAIERTALVEEDREVAAVRYHAMVQLAGHRFEDITIDVGFGDPSVIDAEIIHGPDLLDFADIPPAEVPALPLEQHVAEKVHAYTRSYAGRNPSTRVKDLIDVAVISTVFSFQAGRLRRALEATFTSRGTHPLPSALPTPPAVWQTPYRKMAAEVGLAPDLSEGHEQASVFLDPILSKKVADDARWDSVQRRWSPSP